MGKRFIAATTAAVLVMVGATVLAPTPSSADILSPTELSGNFAGDAREEVFMYTAGPATDYMVSYSNQGVSCGQLTWARYPHIVNADYYPVAGNFDGDAYDEIIWYAEGPAPDYLTNFPSLTTSTSIELDAVNGDYIPAAGDFSGDGVDDVIWYAPTAGDFMWDFNPGGARQTVNLNIGGADYVPVAGSFGRDATDDVHWYLPGTGDDYFWDFRRGTHTYTSALRPVNGVYTPPFVLDIFADGWRGEDVFWYAPGPATDYIWDYIAGVPFIREDVVGGTYRPTAGDYFNDGHDDILWTLPDGSGFNLWDHAPIPGDVRRCGYSGVFAAPAPSPAGIDTGTMDRAAG